MYSGTIAIDLFLLKYYILLPFFLGLIENMS
jgi:hypothetical protein